MSKKNNPKHFRKPLDDVDVKRQKRVWWEASGDLQKVPLEKSQQSPTPTRLGSRDADHH